MDTVSDAQLESSSDKSVSNCDVCTMPIEDVKLKFNCSTCEEKTPSDEKVNLFMCEICVQSHTRRKHDVLDYKRTKVVVCEQHFVWCNSFCEDCDLLICNTCIQQHAVEKHTIIPLEQQANAIKREIHEAISSVDKDYKPIVKSLEGAEQFSQKLKEILSDFSAGQNFNNQMLQVFNEVLEEYAEKVDEITEATISAKKISADAVKKLEDIRDSFETKQSNWRELLSLSDGSLVKQFNHKCLELSRDDSNACIDSLVPLLDNVSSLFLTSRKNLKDSLRGAVRNFTEEIVDSLQCIAEDNEILGKRNLDQPEGCKYFRVYPNKRVRCAASDSHFCIAHFKRDSTLISFELIDRNGQTSLKQLNNIEVRFFRMFSCFGGIVFRVDKRGFRALKTSEGKIELLDRWEVDQNNVLGFYYDSGRFCCVYIFFDAGKESIKFADTKYKELCVDNTHDYFISSNISPDFLLIGLHVFWGSEGYPIIKLVDLYRLKKDTEGKSHVGHIIHRDHSAIFYDAAFVSVNNQTVVVTIWDVHNKFIFDFKQEINGSFSHSSQTSKSVEIDAVNEIHFFNSDCYFCTEDGEIICYKNFIG